MVRIAASPTCFLLLAHVQGDQMGWTHCLAPDLLLGQPMQRGTPPSRS